MCELCLPKLGQNAQESFSLQQLLQKTVDQNNQIVALTNQNKIQQENVQALQHMRNQSDEYIQELKDQIADQANIIDSLRCLIEAHTDNRGQWQCVSGYFRMKERLQAIHRLLAVQLPAAARVQLEELLDKEFTW